MAGFVTGTILIPNRTFLSRFGGISGEYGRAMVRVLARRSRAKIPMARPNEPDMPPKRDKKVRSGIYRIPKLFSPKFSVAVIKSARCDTEWPERRIMRVNKSWQTGQNEMNQKYFECYTASKATNRGSKICGNPFSAKLLPHLKTSENYSISQGNEHNYLAYVLVLASTFFAPCFDRKTLAKY